MTNKPSKQSIDDLRNELDEAKREIIRLLKRDAHLLEIIAETQNLLNTICAKRGHEYVDREGGLGRCWICGENDE